MALIQIGICIGSAHEIFFLGAYIFAAFREFRSTFFEINFDYLTFLLQPAK